MAFLELVEKKEAIIRQEEKVARKVQYLPNKEKEKLQQKAEANELKALSAKELKKKAKKEKKKKDSDSE